MKSSKCRKLHWFLSPFSTVHRGREGKITFYSRVFNQNTKACGKANSYWQNSQKLTPPKGLKHSPLWQVPKIEDERGLAIAQERSRKWEKHFALANSPFPSRFGWGLLSSQLFPPIWVENSIPSNSFQIWCNTSVFSSCFQTKGALSRFACDEKFL